MPDRDDIPQKILLENTEEDRKSTPEGSLVVFESDDFAEETKMVIGQYFRDEFEDNNNLSTAQIDDGPELEIFNENADANSENSFTAKFPDGQASEARTAFENQSVSLTFDRDVLPGKQGDVNSENEVQASILLGELRNDPTPVADEVARRIRENASFGPDQRYIANPDDNDERSVPEDVAGTRRHLLQTEFGVHGPKKLFGELEIEEGVTPTLTIQQLQNLGCQILLESSGEVFIPSDPSDVAQALAARGSTAAVPGVARLGFRVDKNRFGALQTLRSNTNPDLERPEVDIDLSSTRRGSYGSVNNPYVPFAAISSGFSSVIVGTLLSITFSEIFILLAELLSSEGGANGALSNVQNSLSTPRENVQISTIDEKRRRLGSYIPRDPVQESPGSNFGFALLGLNDVDLLRDTQFSYKDALQEGVKVFFGISNSDFLPGVLASATRIAETPGYYNGVLRVLVRSVVDPLFDIAGSVASLIGEDAGIQGSGPGDVNPLIGPPSDPTNLIGVVNVIKESKFLKFMNVLAVMGDISLRQGTEISAIDSIADSIDNRNAEEGDPDRVVNIASLHKKNRLSNLVEQEFRGTLAWGSNTVRSMFFMNDKIVQAENVYFGEGAGGAYSELASNRNVKQSGNRRFTADEVREMERELDSYYVPFYFHDLRTNEIISFHAFLDTVSDTYDVAYNESQGYGRIGKVYTYQNTNRNIQLSFKVVSTNPNDFDQMWLKINKLTMMLFPQYTAGRAVTFDSQKIIQPFSQIPSASPIVRLRVGDLIKSNFSEFDLARLFGIGTESFQLSEQAREQDRDRERRLRRGRTEAEAQFQNYQYQRGDTFIVAQRISQVGSTASGNSEDQFIRIDEDRQGLTARQRATRTAQRQTRRQRRGRRRPTIDIPVGARAVIDEVVNEAEKIYRVRFTPPLPITGTDERTTFRAVFTGQQAGLVRPDPVTLRSRARENAGLATTPDGTATGQEVTDANNLEDVRNFFATTDRDGQATEGNPIFKSFESTRGEGLAGVIKNMAFNWDGAVWETEGLNNRAPKWCTIDVTFAPIFDLNPGLDSNGNPIGMPYNIGQILNKIKYTRNQEAQDRYVSDNATASHQGEEPDDSEFDPLTGLI